MSSTTLSLDAPMTDRLRHFERLGDPLADALVADIAKMTSGRGMAMLGRAIRDGIDTVEDAPPSMRAFFEQVDTIPDWVDWEKMKLASAALLHAGGLGVFCMACYVTPLFYVHPFANKPLTFTGNLKQRAARRGRETCRFVFETFMPRGLERRADGWATTVRVRVMHAYARHHLLNSGRWDGDQYGTPINQTYMASMSCFLSVGWLRGLNQLGIYLSQEEKEAVVHLWRYSAHLMGIDKGLQFANENAALTFWDAYEELRPAPDEDARLLVRALLDAIPEVVEVESRRAAHLSHFGEAMSRYLLGSRLANELDLARTPWLLAMPILRGGGWILRALAKRSPKFHQWSRLSGTRLWMHISEYPEEGLEMFRPSQPQATDTAAS